VNRPAPGLDLAAVIDGLAATRSQFAGRMWLEVMLVAGINDSADDLRALREAIDRIAPERVQINTVLRPPAEADAAPLTAEALLGAQEALGPRAEIVAPLDDARLQASAEARTLGDVRELLRRRPCTLADVAAGLSIHRNEAAKYVAKLEADGEIDTVTRSGRAFFIPRPQP
jgi:wyosine [tRNA(Phe)-imidazoG37] synthetase (radical SAM superfamily)